MRFSRLLAVLVVVVGLGAGAAVADVIKLDFNGSNGPTQEGWLGVGVNNRLDNGTAVDCGGGVLAGLKAWATMTGGDRGTQTADNPDLLRDFMEITSYAGNHDDVGFGLTGLQPGDYYVTVISGDSVYWRREDRVDLNGVIAELPDWPNDPTTATLAGLSLTVTVTVGGDGVLALRRVLREGGGAYWFGKLAGLMVEPVPEPAAVALLVMGAGALLARRRRR